MNFWEENKLFVIAGGVVLVVFIYLWPSLIGEWLAPWRGPVVVRPNAKEHAEYQRRVRQREKDIKRIYDPEGKSVPAVDASRKAGEGNTVLLANYQEMHRWMSFVPRFPFRIPERRKQKNERQRYVSLAYTYAREGEFPCPEFEIRDPADGVEWLAGTRNIPIGDHSFGLRNMERPDDIEDPDTVIKQVALVHELGHLAIRVGVDEITAIQPGDHYAWGIDDVPVATAYPVTVKIKCNLPALLAFVHALDGAHGLVDDVQDLGVAAEAAAPVKPKPRPKPAAGGEEEDDNAPGPGGAVARPGPAAPPREATTKIVIQVHGSPSLFGARGAQSGLKERFTIFRPAEKDPHDLTFIGNAIVRRVLPGGKIEAELEDLSNHCFVDEGKTVRNTVQKGDFAATRFFLIRSMKVKSVDATIKTDDDGFPTEVTPAHLDAEISVAGVRFHKPEEPKAPKKGKGPSAKKKGGAKRPYKKPGRRL